jgi:hypothetical protein
MHQNSMLLASNNPKTVSTEPNQRTTGSIMSLLTRHLHKNTKELGLHRHHILYFHMVLSL